MINLMTLLLDSPFVASIGWCILHSVWQLALIGMVVAAISRCVPEHHSEFKYWIAMTGLLFCLIAPMVTWTQFQPAERTAGSDRFQVSKNIADSADASTSVLADGAGKRLTGELDANRDSQVPLMHDAGQHAGASVDRQRPGAATITWTAQLDSWIPTLVPLWGFGVLLMLLRPAASWIWIYQLRRRSVAVPGDLRQRFRTMKSELGIRSKVALLQSTLVKIPMAFGLLRQAVVIPTSILTNLTATELDAVLLHELAHLRRRDPWFNLFQLAAEILFFYHPAVWWISRRARNLREHCCDDAAIRLCQDQGASLAKALLKLELEASPQLAMAANDGELLQRIRRIAGSKGETRGALSSLAASVASLILLGLVFSVGLSEVSANTNLSFLEKIGSVRRDASNESVAFSITDQKLAKPVSFKTRADLDKISPKATSLVYKGSDEYVVDDSFAKAIAHKFLRLRHLDIAYARNLTDEGFCSLAKLPDLVALRIRFANRLTKKSVQELTKHDRIVSADFSYCPAFTDNPGILELLKLTKIRNLVLIRHVAGHATEMIQDPVLEHATLERILFNPRQKFVDKIEHAKQSEDDANLLIRFQRLETVNDAPWENYWRKLDLLGRSDLPSKVDESWKVEGTVRDGNGKPLGGVLIRVFTGIGSLQLSNETKTDANGQYQLEFKEGGLTSDPDAANVQMATVNASIDGYAEKNLCRQGDRLMARHEVDRLAWGDKKTFADKVILRGKPAKIDFIMLPAATLEGFLTDEDGRGYAKRKLSLVGPELPPSSSVLSQVTTTEEGKYQFKNVPLNRRWRFQLSLAQARTEIKSDEFRLLDSKIFKHQLRLNPDQKEISGFQLKLNQLDESTQGKLERQSRNRVQGVKVAKDESLHWGAETNGLQAAIIGITSDVSLEQTIAPKVVVRNVSDQAIRFETTRWRQEDRPRLTVDGKRIRPSMAWYSGWPRLQLTELEPGEQIELQLGKMAFFSNEKFKPEDPTPYRFHTATGSAKLSLQLKLPDIGAAEAGHWEGALQTGEVSFQLKAGK